MKEFRFTVAIFTGGPQRPKMTAKAVSHIQSQTFTNIQKILVSNGRSDEELNEIFELAGIDIDKSNWEVLRLPELYDPRDLASPYRVPGRNLMPRIKGEFTFVQNDDDFVALDFFMIMDESLLIYPEANTAIGIPINFDYGSHSQEFIPAEKFKERPLVEAGQDLFDRVVVAGDSEYGFNPGFSWICRSSLIKKAGVNFFTGGLMEWPALLQIVPSGPTIFDRRGRMYLGRHSGQQRYDWSRDNLFLGNLYRDMKRKKRANIRGARSAGTLSLKNLIGIKIFFSNAKAQEALRCLYLLYKNELSVEVSVYLKLKLVIVHATQAITSPWKSIRILLKDYLRAT